MGHEMINKGFSTFQLKIIATILMVIDHIGVFIPGTPIWLRYLGRLSAPIFFFCMAWGIYYTKNRKYYLLRLYIASVMMELFWCIMENIGLACIPDYNKNNIFTTLFVVATIITILFPRELGNRNYFKRIMLIVIWQIFSTMFSYAILLNSIGVPERIGIALSGNMFLCEGGLKWCILGVLLYLIKNSRKTLIIGYLGYSAILKICSMTAIFARIMYYLEYQNVLGGFLESVAFGYGLIVGCDYHFVPIVPHGLYLGDVQWLMIGALPFMLLYNFQAGRKCKWFFYVFYPLHFFILLCISYYLNVGR